MNILFLCSGNRRRSPTAEQIFAARPDIEVASAGLNRNAENRCTPDLVAWADKIFVMEISHSAKLHEQFRPHIQPRTKIICLNIQDHYKYLDPQLIKLLQQRVTPHLPATRPDDPSYTRRWRKNTPN